MLRGENTQKVYRLGDKVQVQVIRVNMERRQIDLGLVEILERVREDERSAGRGAARRGRRPSARGSSGPGSASAPRERPRGRAAQR